MFLHSPIVTKKSCTISEHCNVIADDLNMKVHVLVNEVQCPTCEEQPPKTDNLMTVVYWWSKIMKCRL